MLRLFVFLVCFLQLPVQAEKYTVASENFNYFPHYNFQSDTDKGFIWAVLEAFSAFSGDHFTYHALPVLRLQRELNKGTVDLIYPDNPLFDDSEHFTRKKYYSSTLAYTLSGTMIDSSQAGQGVSEIRRLAIPLGFTPLLEWENRVKAGQLQLISALNPLAALRLLAMERVDAAEADYFVSQYQIKISPSFSEFTFEPNLPMAVVEFKLATVKEALLVDAIDHFVETHQPLINKLKKQYGLSDPQIILRQLQKGIPKDNLHDKHTSMF